jgi:hypothetical protein
VITLAGWGKDGIFLSKSIKAEEFTPTVSKKAGLSLIQDHPSRERLTASNVAK